MPGVLGLAWREPVCDVRLWLGRQEALALASACYALPSNAVVVEIGSFLGRSAIMLAGARKTRGSGRVHMLFLDGDQSPEGARLAYDAWAPFLKVGGHHRVTQFE